MMREALAVLVQTGNDGADVVREESSIVEHDRDQLSGCLERQLLIVIVSVHFAASLQYAVERYHIAPASARSEDHLVVAVARNERR